jgi:YHS domain-containing protein
MTQNAKNHGHSATNQHAGYNGESKDPVCGMETVRSSAAATAIQDGRTYYFCSRSCLSTFEADPASFRLTVCLAKHYSFPRRRNLATSKRVTDPSSWFRRNWVWGDIRRSIRRLARY